MLKAILYLVMIFSTAFLQAQQKDFWLIDKDSQKKNMVKDSAAAVKFLDSLAQTSYFFAKLESVEKKDNRTEIVYDKGPNFNQAQVKFSDSLQKELNYPKEIFVKNLDSLRQKINQNYRNKGFAFNRVKTRFVDFKNNVATVQISVNTSQQRRINSFVVRGYERVPKRFIKNLEKTYLNKIYDDNNLVSINRDLQGHNFVSLEKPPQTLFTKDSTQIYLFLQKKKVNNFDGMLGFGNDKSEKFTFNGTINVSLRNMFNGFESIGLYWQRNPDRGQTFDLQTDIPYVFNSNVGVNFGVNIYRQDSTFASVKFRPSLYLHLSQNQKIGLRGTFESSAVLDSLYTQAQDFTKKGVGLWYQYQTGSEIPLFLYNTHIRAEFDFIKSTYDKTNLSVNQLRYFVTGEHNLHLSGNHYLNLKAESALLSAKNDLSVNELFRFGGWNSFRGFNELSLISDFYAFAGAEYRYLVNDRAFFDIFAQYGSMSNKALNVSPSLYSFGLGFNFFLPVGLMSFQISNGSQFGVPFKFAETKIHWGIVSRF
ncbi:hypothetical protein [Soonwooa purpurea]